jgi:uncharacterized protein
MKLTQDLAGGSYRIRSYEAGRLRVNEFELEASVVISPSEMISDWQPQTLDELTVDHFEAIHAMEPEVVLLGTGERQRFPARELLRALILRGVGVEVMDTGAASRTFNVLAGEGRRVVAALLLR